MSDLTTSSLPTAARLLTTAIAGALGYAATGLATFFVGPARELTEILSLMGVFVAVYVPAVFASRRVLLRVIREARSTPAAEAPVPYATRS